MLTTRSRGGTLLRTHRHTTRQPDMLLTLPSHRMGLLEQLRDMEHNRGMAECRRPGPTGLHAGQLHSPTRAEDTKPLPVGLPDCGSHLHNARVHDTTRSVPGAVL